MKTDRLQNEKRIRYVQGNTRPLPPKRSAVVSREPGSAVEISDAYVVEIQRSMRTNKLQMHGEFVLCNIRKLPAKMPRGQDGRNALSLGRRPRATTNYLCKLLLNRGGRSPRNVARSYVAKLCKHVWTALHPIAISKS
jgi:hypothetical protein